MVNSPQPSHKEDSYCGLNFRSGVLVPKEFNNVPGLPRTSGPKKGLDLELFQAASPLLSALMHFPSHIPWVEMTEGDKVSIGRGSNWHELVIQANPP